MTYRYVTKYFRYEVSHNFSRIKTDKPFYPSVTFCLPAVKDRMEWYHLSDCIIPKRYVPDTLSNGIFNIDFCNVGGVSDCWNDSVRWREDLKGIALLFFQQKCITNLQKQLCLTFM